MLPSVEARGIIRHCKRLRCLSCRSHIVDMVAIALASHMQLLLLAVLHETTCIMGGIVVPWSNARLDQTSNLVLNLFIAQACGLTLLSKTFAQQPRLF